ncbi:2OG-Fe(II) oxygenase [Psychrobacter sp. VH5]|uniref:2OG-Fe(II) oxygenase n=2 Tax=Psychrobacter TaxID=497 RepID=UPI003D64EAF5
MNAILQLEPTWQQWIANNINRGVAYHKIINTLFERGFYSAAYELMSQQSGTINIPYMDMSHNSIVLPDKTVRLASTFYPPFVAVIEGFLSHKECDQLISSAEGNMRDSRVVSPVDGTFAEHDARTSKSHGFQRGATPLITTIENRIAALLHWPVAHGEGLQVLKYGKGQEYRPHYDFFDPKNANYQKNIGKGGQRVGTLLMYLSDVEAGGGTNFPKINLEVRPKKGMALYFANTKFDGSIEPLSLHAGMPVNKGTKFLATKWLRANPYVS